MNIIWIDDVASTLFRPLVRMLKRRGFAVDTAISYKEALRKLDQGPSGGGRYQFAILDLIVPHSEDGTIDSVEVGFVLAERAIENGVERLAFCSLVARDRAEDQVRILMDKFPDVDICYIEKTEGSPHELVSRFDAFFREAAADE